MFVIMGKGKLNEAPACLEMFFANEQRTAHQQSALLQSI